MLKPIAISDEVATCDCCGKSNLKRTVVLQDDNGGIRYHGTSCAAMAIYGYSDANVNNKVRKEAITAQSYEKQRKEVAAKKAANAKEALDLLTAGYDLDHPVILAQHRVWRQSNNPLNPGPNFTPWKKWLEARSVAL